MYVAAGWLQAPVLTKSARRPEILTLYFPASCRQYLPGPSKLVKLALLSCLVQNWFTFASLPKQESLCQTISQKSFIKTKINTIMAKKLSVTPLQDRVIVKPAPAEEKTAGGIIIPDTAKEKPQRGTVMAAGPGKKDEPVTVKIGDTVLYGKYSGTEIQIEGDDFLIMRESDILAIV
jgi:chaperonin GroES